MIARLIGKGPTNKYHIYAEEVKTVQEVPDQERDLYCCKHPVYIERYNGTWETADADDLVIIEDGAPVIKLFGKILKFDVKYVKSYNVSTS